jgi:uncharacterized membrane protein YkvA (DUF1232 family)
MFWSKVCSVSEELTSLYRPGTARSNRVLVAFWHQPWVSQQLPAACATQLSARSARRLGRRSSRLCLGVQAKPLPTFRIDQWKARVATLKADTYALYLAYRDPRVPWPAKLVAALVVAYALSPIDLIPDFIPIVGYLDDLVLVPLGLALAIRLIPPTVLAEHRARAAELLSQSRPTSWVGAAIVLAVWVATFAWLASIVWHLLPE